MTVHASGAFFTICLHTLAYVFLLLLSACVI